MDDAASVLAPNPGPIVQLDPGQNDPLASYSPAQQTPPVAVGAQPDTNVTAPPGGSVPTIDTPSTSSVMVDAPDPAVYAAAAHQREVAGFLSKALTVMAGGQTHHVATNPDGSVSVHLDESTDKEKWGRIAVALLGGAAKGLAVGQGPGGAARAVSAGIDNGLNMPKQAANEANKQAEAKQQIMLRNAQNARLNQDIVRMSFNNDHMNRDDLQAQADRATKNMIELRNQGFEPLLTGAKTPKEIAQYGIANPLAVGMHMGVNGDMVYNEPDGNGGVNIYSLSADNAQSPTTKPTVLDLWSTDPSDPKAPLKHKDLTIPAGTKKGDLATRMMAVNTSNDAVAKSRFSSINDQTKTKTEQDKAADEATKTNSIIARNKAGAAESYARAQQIRTQSQNEAGTPEQNAQMMVDGLAAPSQFSKRAKDYNQLLPLANAYSMQKYGIPFDAETSEARYRARQAVVKDYADGKEADQIQSFNQFLGHSQDFTDSIAALRNTNSPLLNMPLNKLRKLSGRPEVASILPKIEAVRTEYQNFLNNNHALHNEDISEGRKMLDEDASPAQMEAAAKSFARTALIRTGTVNDRFKRTMKTNVPDLLNDDSLKTLENYGLGDETRRILNSPGHPAQGKPTGTFDVPAGGTVYHFNTQEEADVFKKKAKITP